MSKENRLKGMNDVSFDWKRFCDFIIVIHSYTDLTNQLSWLTYDAEQLNHLCLLGELNSAEINVHLDPLNLIWLRPAEGSRSTNEQSVRSLKSCAHPHLLNILPSTSLSEKKIRGGIFLCNLQIN